MTLNDLRVSLNWSKRADGSCLLEELPRGDRRQEECSIVLVAVSGPGPVKSRIELIDGATVEVILSPLNYPPGGESDYWAQRLQKVLQESVICVQDFPRSLIQIAIQPIAIGPAFLPLLIDAVYLALLSSCVPLKRPFVALSADSEGPNVFIVDPSDGSILLEECEEGLPDMDFQTESLRRLSVLQNLFVECHASK